MINLYPISERYRLALESIQIDEETGEVIGAEALGMITDDASNAIEQIALWIKNLRAEGDAIDAEARQLLDRKSKITRRADYLANHILTSMISMDMEKVSSPKVVVKVGKPRASTIIDDLERLPEEYVRTTVKLDGKKTEIKAAILSGQEIPGAHVEYKPTLSIK